MPARYPNTLQKHAPRGEYAKRVAGTYRELPADLDMDPGEPRKHAVQAIVNAVWARHQEAPCPIRICFADSITRRGVPLPYRGVISFDEMEITFNMGLIDAQPYKGSADRQIARVAAHEATHAVQVANGEILVTLSEDLDLTRPLGEMGCPRPETQAYRQDRHEIEADAEADALLQALGIEEPTAEHEEAREAFEKIFAQEPLASLARGMMNPAIVRNSTDKDGQAVPGNAKGPVGYIGARRMSGLGTLPALILAAQIGDIKPGGGQAKASHPPVPEPPKYAEAEHAPDDTAPFAPPHVKRKGKRRW